MKFPEVPRCFGTVSLQQLDFKYKDKYTSLSHIKELGGKAVKMTDVLNGIWVPGLTGTCTDARIY